MHLPFPAVISFALIRKDEHGNRHRDSNKIAVAHIGNWALTTMLVWIFRSFTRLQESARDLWRFAVA